jgi:predicted  nucleic acid-binding Zn-ribbon protein
MTNEQIEVLRGMLACMRNWNQRVESEALLAAITLGERVRDAATGEVVEVGDDSDGQPRALIHSTREELRKGGSLAFKRVALVRVEG